MGNNLFLKTFLKNCENFVLGKDYYKLHYNHYLPILRNLIVPDCRTLLDVGCGNNSPIQSFSNLIYSVGVDISETSIFLAKEKRIHNQYYVCDIRKLSGLFQAGSFDCVLASDVIEHLKKEEGVFLIKEMEKIAKKRVVIFTPNGYVPQKGTPENPYQQHLSGWNVQEMRSLGYRVFGIHGFKWFRKEQAQFRSPEKVFM